MTNTTYQIKQFIADFNFPNPDWESLPVGFPYIPKEGLTKEEAYLLDGIKLAWTANAGGWKHSALKGARTGLVCLIGLISLIGLIGFITQPGGNELTRTVNAATVQVDDFIQSTMSAILKHKTY